MEKKTRFKILIFSLLASLISCSNQLESENFEKFMIELVMADFDNLSLDNAQGRDFIVQSLGGYEGFSPNFIDFKGAQVNATCRLLDKAMDLNRRNYDPELAMKIKKLKSGLQVKIDNTKYGYSLFSDCRDVFDLKFVSPRKVKE